MLFGKWLKVDLLGTKGFVSHCEYAMTHVSPLYLANNPPPCVTLYSSAL